MRNRVPTQIFKNSSCFRNQTIPHFKKQLHSFMGVLNHLQKFLPTLHLLTEQFRPSQKMSHKQKFIWGTDQQKTFENTLNLFSNMYHYDQKRNSRVKCDASHIGQCAALVRELLDGSWVPILFASRFLNIQEKKYCTK